MGRYLVWCDDIGQDEADGKIFAASGPREAAEQWGQWQDTYSAEYSIVGGTACVATVVSLDRGDRTKWRVEGESVPVYRARPAQPNAIELTGSPLAASPATGGSDVE